VKPGLPAPGGLRSICAMPRTHVIEIRVDDIRRLFNSMDPAPFHERDLDHDAEEYIVSCANEYPAGDGLDIRIHLGTAPDPDDAAALESAIRHYFTYRAGIQRRELGLLWREARISLLVGLAFLSLCLTLAHAIAPDAENDAGGWLPIIRESLTIVGWVSMWKPIDTALYCWWPVLRQVRILRKLAVARVILTWPDKAT
jgi:hypothetical protein